MNLLRAAILLALCSLFLPGCIYGGCTDDFRPSFLLSVKDAEGHLVEDIRVTYRLDDGTTHEAQCTSIPVMAGACPQWSAVHDKPGVFHIKVETLDGTRSVEKSVTVGGNMCHADPETVELRLL